MERLVFVAAIVFAAVVAAASLFDGHIQVEHDGGHRRGFGVDVEVEVAQENLPARTYVGDHIVLDHGAARLVITPEDRDDIEIEIANPGKAPTPLVTAAGGEVRLDGRLRGRIEGCDGRGVRLRGYGALTAAELPLVTIRAPRALVVEIDSAGPTEIGPSNSLEASFIGCGDATLGAVAGRLELDHSGTGAVRAGGAGTADVSLSGPGRVETGPISGSADIDLAGSGAVELASVTGDLSASTAGSGDIAVRGGRIGAADIDIAGSGSVRMAAPVTRADIDIAGSGDVIIDGEAGDLSVDIAGSGDVRARAVRGRVVKDVWGSGDVHIGN